MATLKVDTITSADTPTVSITDGASISGVTTFSSDINIADKIVHTGDTNTAIRFSDADTITAETGGSERVRIHSTGELQIGDSTKSSLGSRLLQIGKTDRSDTYVEIRNSTSGTGGFVWSDGTAADNTGYRGTIEYSHGNDAMYFKTAATERLRITSNGEVLIGHNAVIGHNGVDGYLQVTGTGSDSSSFNLNRFSADNWCPFITFGKSRNATKGSHTVVQDGDYIGYIQFAASDGTDFNNAAANLICQIDGTPGTDDTPGRLIFKTCADGTNSPTERVRIDKNGQLVLSNGSMSTAYGNSICGGTNLELDTTGIIKFRTDTNQKMSVTDNGLCFGTDSAAANALDDYEEGSFTPTLTGGSTAGSPTYQHQAGWYTKVGNLVTVNVNLATTNTGSGAGNMRIGALPFTCASNTEGIGAVQYNQIGSGLPSGREGPAFAIIQNPNTYAEIRVNDAGTDNYTALAIQTVQYLRVTIQYTTA